MATAAERMSLTRARRKRGVMPVQVEVSTQEIDFLARRARRFCYLLLSDPELSYTPVAGISGHFATSLLFCETWGGDERFSRRCSADAPCAACHQRHLIAPRRHILISRVVPAMISASRPSIADT